MKVATILPTPLLKHLPLEGGYQMSLWKEIKEIPEYNQFYKNCAQEGQFVIMDNGAAEGVNPMAEELMPVYPFSNPSEVVLPDVVGNSDETFSRSYDAYNQFLNAGLNSKYQFMFVPQGASFHEWCYSLGKALHYMPNITTIGVSKFVCKLWANEYPETNIRLMCCKYITEVAARLHHPLQIHLLGCWDNPAEVGEIALEMGDAVRGTDSAIAYVYTRNGVVIDGITPRPDNEEIDFKNGDLPVDKIDLLKENIIRWEKLCNGLPL